MIDQRPSRDALARVIAGKISCEQECASNPSGCGCSYDAADAVMALYIPVIPLAQEEASPHE